MRLIRTAEVVKELNHFYRRQPASHELDFSGEGFSWIDCATGGKRHQLRAQARSTGDTILAVCNFTPVPRHIIGRRTAGGFWRKS